ncbi:hypothetical protein JDV02_010392 [Purpureocillium takamizusanense]|uniref:Uncharacterized protein n=1 Tax=Purpureocillium takamizusanense TaxID=2060973 RepID=A0A9Q8QRX4_9HYPO|nr:uncharacterized protein JDV02_010392 [Purpureocillium takamizusanense]UNI24660.1 hypothetical protein JDV02_010392 [Purpureocillium takamizusanense]
MEVPTREEREDPFAGDGFDARRASAIAAASSVDDNTILGGDDDGDDGVDNDHQDTTILTQGQAAHQGEDAAAEDVDDYPANLPPRPPGRLSFVRPGTPQFGVGGGGSYSSSRPPSRAFSVRNLDPRRRLRLFLLGDDRRDGSGSAAAGGDGSASSNSSSGRIGRQQRQRRRQRQSLSARIMGLFSHKRKVSALSSSADQQAEAVAAAAAAAAAAGRVVTVHLPDPILLKFLFVGGKGAGQTSLLVKAYYNFFPDTVGSHRPNYVAFYLPRRFHDKAVSIEC